MDQAQTVKFAMDITKGMAYLHSMDPLIPRLHLSSTHVMVSFRICTVFFIILPTDTESTY